MSGSSSGLVAQLVARRGDFKVDVGVRAEAGRFTALVGPNGAGKTTVLRALAGLTPLESGVVRLGDRLLDNVAAGVHVPAEDRHVGLVFQRGQLFRRMTVRDNVAFPIRARGASKDAAREAARPVIERFGLTALADRFPHQLSGGETQRVALARAVAAEPEMLLLDEPFSATDAAATLELRDTMRSMLAGFAGPMVVVTHDLDDAVALADHVVVMEDGRVSHEGDLISLSGAPTTPWLAAMLGMNLLIGPFAGLHAPRSGASFEPAGANDVRFSFAPADVHLGEPPSEAAIRWPVTVGRVRRRLGMVEVELATDDGQRITALVAPADAPTEGAVTTAWLP